MIFSNIININISKFIPSDFAKNVKVPTLLIHGKEDELVNISHSRDIFKNIHRHTHKILLEVDGMHNDSRPQKSINTIRDFMFQYSYDALIVKEHRRRLNIKNAQINYNMKNRIDINSIVESFRNNQKKEIKKYLIYENNDKIKQNESKKLFFKENKSEFKKENRRLNNFEIGFNKSSFDHNNKLIRSKSQEIQQKSFKNKNNFLSDILEIIKNIQEKEKKSKIRNKSLLDVKIKNFYKKILFNDILNEGIEEINKKIDILFDKNTNNKEEEIDYLRTKKPSKRSNFSLFNEKNYQFENENNFFLDENLNEYSNKTSYKFGEMSQFEYSSVAFDEKNNYTDIHENKTSLNNNRGKIKTRRNQVLSGILDCNVKLGSSNIKITNLDKTSLRKGRDQLNFDKNNENPKDKI